MFARWRHDRRSIRARCRNPASTRSAPGRCSPENIRRLLTGRRCGPTSRSARPCIWSRRASPMRWARATAWSSAANGCGAGRTASTGVSWRNSMSCRPWRTLRRPAVSPLADRRRPCGAVSATPCAAAAAEPRSARRCCRARSAGIEAGRARRRRSSGSMRRTMPPSSIPAERSSPVQTVDYFRAMIDDPYTLRPDRREPRARRHLCHGRRAADPRWRSRPFPTASRPRSRRTSRP